MKALVLSFGLLIAFAACSSDSKGVGTTAASVTTGAGTVNLGDACGGSDPAAVSCDEAKNLYCQQDPDADPSAPGTCASCGDLEAVSLVCDDGTIQPGLWVAIDQTCQIIGCGTAQAGDACDNSAADPSVTCALPLFCTQGVCSDDPGTTDVDAGTSQTGDDAGTDEDADTSTTTDDDAGATTGDDDTTDDAGDDTAEDAGLQDDPQLVHVKPRRKTRG